MPRRATRFGEAVAQIGQRLARVPNYTFDKNEGVEIHDLPEARCVVSAGVADEGDIDAGPGRRVGAKPGL